MQANIKVIGLGGAGNNAVNRMIEAGLVGVQFIAANTDAQVLAKSHAEIRIQMGDRLTRGLGAGANPEVGEKAALEDRERIKEYLQDSDLIFITAGMGGGTGTGSAPIVAEIARELGALAIGIVTRPFHFEGPKRLRLADEGIKRLAENVDGMIIVDNEKLLANTDRKITFKEAFLIADRVLYYGVKGISDVINVDGMINVDFADVKNLLSNAGPVLMGIGSGRGDKMVEEAALSAVHSPLLERGIDGAKRLLVNITGSENLTLSDAHEIVEKIRASTGSDEVEILFGVTTEESPGDLVRVTVIATGFADNANNPLSTSNQRINTLLGPNRGRIDQNDYEVPAFLRYKDKDRD